MKLKIAMLGAGNVAVHLARAFNDKGHKIIQVYSRKIKNAQFLANQLDSKAVCDFALIDNSADLYVIAVSDNAIEQIVEKIDFIDKNVVHTAGSVGLSVFNENTKNCGIFYPLQTFSKNRNVDFNNIPICIEANTNSFNLSLNNLAKQISNKVYQINSDDRKTLHLSAVFACNFVNHLYAVAEEILKEKEIPFEILHELIKESASKAIEMDPTHAQTGPAIRNDAESLKKHLDLLSSKPGFYQIYELLSKAIYLKYNKLHD